MRIALIIVVVLAAMIGSGWLIATYSNIVIGIVAAANIGKWSLQLIDRLTFTVSP